MAVRILQVAANAALAFQIRMSHGILFFSGCLATFDDANRMVMNVGHFCKHCKLETVGGRTHRMRIARKTMGDQYVDPVFKLTGCCSW